jgi:hypothetical protein
MEKLSIQLFLITMTLKELIMEKLLEQSSQGLKMIGAYSTIAMSDHCCLTPAGCVLRTAFLSLLLEIHREFLQVDYEDVELYYSHHQITNFLVASKDKKVRI